MAAITIGPDFYTYQTLGGLPRAAGILLSGLSRLADPSGRIEEDFKRLRLTIPSYYDCDVEELLTLLASVIDDAGTHIIARYTIDGQRYIQLTGFGQGKRTNPKCGVSAQERLK